MKYIVLIAAAVAVLAVAAVAAEEPASQPAPAASTIEASASIPPKWMVCIDCGVVELGYLGIAITVLTLAMLVYFVLGLAKHQHDWKPLVLGLFVLGLELLGAALGIIDACMVLASRSNGNPADFIQSIGWALWAVAMGLIVAMLGGLFTVILRWRNERLRKREADKSGGGG